MAFVPGSIGFGEARLKALRALLLANLDGAEAQLARTDEMDTSYLLTGEFGDGLDREQTLINGELLGTWDRKDGCLRIAVTSGGHQSGEIFHSERVFMDASPQRGLHYGYTTNIHAYFHPDCWSQTNPFEQAAAREYALERIADWLTWGVLNYGTNLDLLLESQCYVTAGGSVYDHLTNCRVMSCQSGVFYRAFSATIALYGIRCLHVGEIE